MKKRLVIFITLILALLVSVFGLIACGDNEGDAGKDGIDAKIYAVYKLYAAEEEKDGKTPLSYEEWIKSIKGEKGENGKSAYEIWLNNGHTGTEEEFLEWLKGESDNPQGLDFYSLPDGTYAVSFGKAFFMDKIVIPTTYKGKTISKILETMGGKHSFEGADIYYEGTIHEWIKVEKDTEFDELSYCSVYLNNTLISEITDIVIDYNIPKGGLMGLSGLKTVTIGKDVKNIEEDSFAFCETIERITVDVDNPNYSSEDGILYNKAKTKIIYVPRDIKGGIVIPDTITSIGYVFSYCSSLESITIGNGVTSIGDRAFSGCSSLESVTIGSGVTSIGNRAFSGCEALETIYYKGSKTTWDNITDSYFILPSSTTLYYYSETAPIKEGNFWHYVNGVPTVW